MLTVKYQTTYYNDARNRAEERSFASEQEFIDWCQSFRTPLDSRRYPRKEVIVPIILTYPFYDGVMIWIHQITSDRGIEFTDGVHTQGQKHLSDEMVRLFERCQGTPVYNFA